MKAIPTVIYDLRANPITFDFCTFLASCSIIFKARSASGFDLAIVATGFRNVTPREKSYSLDDRYWRLDNLISPVAKACSLVRNLSIVRSAPSEDGFFAVETYPRGFRFEVPLPVDYSPRFVINLYDKTKIAPFIFKPSESAKSALTKNYLLTESGFITLSPRVAAFDQSRNSELAEWFNLYLLLVERGYRVMILPDLDDALGARVLWNYDWPILEIAAFSLDVRIVIMHLAKNNVISSGGLGAVATYSEMPYVICNVLHDRNPVANADYFRSFVGLEVGAQYPWVKDNQRYDWGSFDARRIFHHYIAGK